MSAHEALEASYAPAQPRFVRDLDTLIRARYPLLYLVSWEEQRIEAILQDLAAQHGKALFSWSIARGLRRIGGSQALPALDVSKAPLEVLGTIAKLGTPALVVLKDFHAYLSDSTVVRALRELAQDLKSTYTTVILLSPSAQIPVELEKDISVLDVPLPGFRELYQLLREIVAVVRQGNRASIDLSREQAEQLIKAAQGLTLSEAENAFAKAIANDGVLNGQDIKLVLDETRQVVRKSGVTARVFGAFLTWLQEKTEPVFVVATANQIGSLPPELVRRGRFDEIFFIDLPATAERSEIWRIHIARRRRDPRSFDLAELAQRTEGFSGAEIEQAVIAGLHLAFAEGKDLEQRHLVRAALDTIPFATTMGEEIARSREWAKTRARPASGRAPAPAV